MSMINRMMQGRHDQRGFTLVEMLMTLLVTAVMMGIAIPAIQLQINRNNLRAAGREVTGILRSARDSAINEGLPRYVKFTPPRTYQQFKYNPAAAGGAGAWEVERSPQSLESTVSFTETGVTFPALTDTPTTGKSVPADAAYFGTRGRYPLTTTGGPFTILLDGRNDRTITLTLYNSTGQVLGV